MPAHQVSTATATHGPIRRHVVTPANIHDSQSGTMLALLNRLYSNFFFLISRLPCNGQGSVDSVLHWTSRFHCLRDRISS